MKPTPPTRLKVALALFCKNFGKVQAVMLLRDICKDMSIAQANKIICRDIVGQEDSIIKEFYEEQTRIAAKIETVPFSW